MTKQFEGADAQHDLAALADDARREMFRVYQGFREINTRADALKQAFRSWRATQYFEAIEDFQAQSRRTAERLVRDLERVPVA